MATTELRYNVLLHILRCWEVLRNGCIEVAWPVLWVVQHRYRSIEDGYQIVRRTHEGCWQARWGRWVDTTPIQAWPLVVEYVVAEHSLMTQYVCLIQTSLLPPETLTAKMRICGKGITASG